MNKLNNVRRALDTVGLLHYQFNYFKFVIIISLCIHLQLYNFKDEHNDICRTNGRLILHIINFINKSSTSLINSLQASPVVISSPPLSSTSELSCSSPLEADVSPPRKKRSYRRVLPYYRSKTSKTTVNDIHLLKRILSVLLISKHVQTKVTAKLIHQQCFSILHLQTVMSSLRLLFIIKKHL